MSSVPHENVDLVRRLFEAFNDQDWDAYRTLIAEDVVLHESGTLHRGADAIIDHDKRFYETYPDATITVDDAFASDDRPAARTTITGSYDGDPSGDESPGDDPEKTGILYGRLDGGVFAEIWIRTD